MAFTLDQAAARIRESLDRGRLAHAYLITGPLGAGKEALACRLIGMVHEKPAPAHLDAAIGDGVTVLRPASKSRRIRVDGIEQLENTLHLTAGRNAVKVGILVEADRLMEQAANKFLKTLEEPPAHTLLLLLTAQPERLLPTILSRCIEVPLLGPVRLAPKADSAEAILLKLLVEFGTLEKRGVRPALRIARGFSDLLAARKIAILKHHEDIFDDDVAAIKKTTEGSGWIDEREDAMKAMAEADYIGEREQLIATLLSWFGDAVRLQAGVDHIDLPECRQALLTLAKRATTSELLLRQQSMERLRELLQTNTSEALAIEVCFLRGFA